MKLLYASEKFTTHDRRFLEAFIAHGLTVEFVSLADISLDARGFPQDLAGAHILSTGWTAKLPLVGEHFLQQKFKLLAEAIKPDIVIAGPIPSIGYIASSYRAAPLIAMSWGSDILVDTTKPEVEKKARATLEVARGAIGDCLAVKRRLSELSSLPDENFAIFPWGIDVSQFTPGPSSLGLRQAILWQGCPIFICTRSWEPLYAIDILLNAFAIVHKSVPEARLLLIGDGSESSKIFDIIQSEQLEEHVHCPGRMDYSLLPDFFRTADIYVSSALSDGTSVSLLEAMGTGLPALVTNSYGNIEWVEEGVNGWLVPPGDSNALSAKMLLALENRDSFTEIAIRNTTLIREKADWSKNISILLNLIDRLAKDKQ